MMLVVKNPLANAGNARDVKSISGLGRSPGVGSGHLLQYSCLEHSMDTGTWWATVHGVAESDMTERSCTHVLLQQGAVIFFIHFTVKTLHVGNLN